MLFLSVSVIFYSLLYAAADKKTAYVINEVYLAKQLEPLPDELLPLGAPPQVLGDSQFIELAYTWHRNPKEHRPLRLLMIESCPGSEPEVVFIADSTFSFAKQKFWVLATTDISHVATVTFDQTSNIIFPACSQEDKLCLSDKVKDGLICPVGIILIEMKNGFSGDWDINHLHSRRVSFGHKIPVSIDSLKNDILSGLLDMVIIFADKHKQFANAQLQDAFLDIFSELLLSKDFVLSSSGFVYADSSVNKLARSSHSLTRCPDNKQHSANKAFRQKWFYRCPFTPGNSNDAVCSEKRISDSMWFDPSTEDEDYSDEDSDTGQNVEMESADSDAEPEPEVEQQPEAEQEPVTQMKKILRPKQEDKTPPHSPSTGLYGKSGRMPIATPRKMNMVIFAIIHVLRSLRSELLTDEAIQQVKRCTGYSRASIHRYWSKHKAAEPLHIALTGPKLHHGRRKIVVDQFWQDAIRRRLFQLWTNLGNKDDPHAVWPNQNVLYTSFQSDMNDGTLDWDEHHVTFPKMSLATFKRLIKAPPINIVFGVYNDKQFFYERPDICVQRHTYLRASKRLMEAGYVFCWQDETWANAHHSHARVLQVKDTHRSDLPSERGRGGPKVPSGAGKRVIINHAGCEGTTGFLKDADGVSVGQFFVGKTGTGDYHNEMNTEHWMEWFQDKVLPALKHRGEAIDGKVVFVIDNAKYHNKVSDTTRQPTTAWRKGQIIEYLDNLTPPPVYTANMLKYELLQLAKAHARPKEYETDRLTREFNMLHGTNIKILRLPIGHCELNPIELIWAQLKRKIATENRTFRINDVRQLAEMVAAEIPNENWDKCVGHARKVEREYWDKDGLMDEIEVQPVTIDLDDDDEDDDESDDAFFEDTGLGDIVEMIGEDN